MAAEDSTMARVQPPSALRHPLTYIFGVDAHVAVLRVLVRHGGPLAGTEIVRRSGVSKSSVRLALMALETLGLVVTEGTQTNRLHRFDHSNWLSAQIQALFAAEADRFSAIQEAVRQAAEACKAPIASLSLYGSVAAGSDRPDSDLDILVVFEEAGDQDRVEAMRHILREPARRLCFLPNVVGLDRTDVRRLRQDRDPWWQDAVENVILLAGTHPGALTAEQGRRRHG
jgi:predicted nucleotidyltransferase